jgi:glucose-6-phosphate 1-dehydrogenase
MTENVQEVLSLRSADYNLDEPLTIVVLGASGDLAKKKTFPALYSLFLHNLLPPKIQIIGYARSELSDDDFFKQISTNFKTQKEQIPNFRKIVTYFTGKYDSNEDFKKLNQRINEFEKDQTAHRIFYLAIPPSVFFVSAREIQTEAKSKSGTTRVIVEKPFGHDSKSSAELSKQLGSLFEEQEIYRIDHYLGKEMVQNLMILRFANSVFEPLWNRFFISNVQITFKEDIGTEGRGGYFDKFGIIRDVMQNHLVQIFALVGMEPPVSLQASDIGDEKVKFLRCVEPLQPEDLVIGQFGASEDGKKPSYLADDGVPKDSRTETFATAILRVNNSRWKGVPFILKCGKGLTERKAEIRIQFSRTGSYLFGDVPPNELVLRVQPDEAVYLKMCSKKPGLSNSLDQIELDITYKDRFDVRLPEAYERLIFDVIRGDHNLFVRKDELAAAWDIFTPALHHLENNKVKPIVYPFGSRGPAESDELIKKNGYIRTEGYVWSKSKI